MAVQYTQSRKYPPLKNTIQTINENEKGKSFFTKNIPIASFIITKNKLVEIK